MQRKPITVLAINPGTRYIGIAVFRDDDLRDWAVKVITGKWTIKKIVKIQAIIYDLLLRYHPDVIAMKQILPSRSSDNLKQTIFEIQKMALHKKIEVYEYSIKDIENFYSPDERINKLKLAQIICNSYPALSHDFQKQCSNTYFVRVLESVALGATCLASIDQPKSNQNVI
jgi:Holliday junction resolvasome RuvABC endonuclease subunit